MYTSYRVVWVAQDSPTIVEDIAADGFEDTREAEAYMRAENSAAHDDGLNWVARIQRVTHEFV